MTLTPELVRAARARLTAPGEIFEIAERDVAGRRYRAFTNAAATVLDLLELGRQHGPADFLVHEGRRWTFEAFFASVDALAAVLQHDLGVAPGDRVAIAMRNCPDWMLAFAATVYAGGVVVPINSWGSPDELAFTLTNSGSRVLFADDTRARLLAGATGAAEVTVVLSDLEIDAPVVDAPVLDAPTVPDLLAAGRGRAYQRATPDPDEVALLLYTSGSTGHPKGVMHRHVAVAQSVMNMFFQGFLLIDLEGPLELRGGAAGEAQLLSVPLFHATGLLSGFVLPCAIGQKVAILRRWDAVTALRLIETEKITMMSTVPAVLKDLLTHPELANHDVSSLIRVAAAGAATPADLPGLLRQKLGLVSRSSGYGMTETMAVAATMSGSVFDLRPASAGILSPLVDIRFVDPAGSPRPAGVEGEIQLRGVTVTPGYWRLAELTAAALTPDGWLRTGDLGFLDDDGFLHVTGRIKEMVIRGGENIYPIEVENAAYRHPAVKEVAVFGVPDPEMGEELALVCFAQPGSDLTEEELRAHLAGLLAKHKVPRHVRLAPGPLPRNASEKIHRFAVRDAFGQPGRAPSLHN